jgi:hypothetical protein
VGRDPGDLRMVGGGNDVAEGDGGSGFRGCGSPAWTKPDCLGGSDVVMAVMIASVTVLYFLLHSKYHNWYLDGGKTKTRLTFGVVKTTTVGPTSRRVFVVAVVHSVTVGVL